MNELIKALTELAVEATLYLRRENHPMITGAEVRPEGQQTGDQIDKTTYVLAGEPALKKKVGRPPKAAVSVEPVISEDESLSEALTVAKEFVQRFQKQTPDGLTRARAILAEHFKVGSIPALSHEQRIQLTGMLKKELAEVA